MGKFKNGKQEGLWKRYHPNGQLYDVGNYLDGKKIGSVEVLRRQRKVESHEDVLKGGRGSHRAFQEQSAGRLGRSLALPNLVREFASLRALSIR